jgi:hypothetical protein
LFVAVDLVNDLFDDLSAGDDDAAAARLNAMLASHPAHPYLAKEAGLWRMHHHPSDAPLIPMWLRSAQRRLPACSLGPGRTDRYLRGRTMRAATGVSSPAARA